MPRAPGTIPQYKYQFVSKNSMPEEWECDAEKLYSGAADIGNSFSRLSSIDTLILCTTVSYIIYTNAGASLLQAR